MTVVIEGSHFLSPTIRQAQKNYELPVRVMDQPLYYYWEQNPTVLFDTIIYLGKNSGQNIGEMLSEIGKHLKPGGKAYLTYGLFKEKPALPFKVPGCRLVLVPQMPKLEGHWSVSNYGLILHRETPALLEEAN